MHDSSLLPARKPALIGFAAAILVVGGLRFALTLSGIPDSVTTFFSMTVVILIGLVYFSIVCTTWRDCLRAALFLYLPYTLVVSIGLGYTWVAGRHTVFQPHEQMFGLSVGQHFAVMLAFGVTVEPLAGCLFMMGMGWLYRKVRQAMGVTQPSQVER